MINILQNILKKGHPIFGKPAESVKPRVILSSYIKNIIAEMSATIDKQQVTFKHQIVGLTANQIGYPVRIICLNTDSKIFMINPAIEKEKGKQISLEGCGSVDGVLCEVERPKYIEVHFYDENGEDWCGEFTDLNAWVVEHEIDHLDGIFITDKAIRIIKLED